MAGKWQMFGSYPVTLVGLREGNDIMEPDFQRNRSLKVCLVD